MSEKKNTEDDESNIHLYAEDISKNFGGIVALDKASLSVKKNSLTSLIGPNGSGKTTLFNVITGWINKSTPEEEDVGIVSYNGKRIDGMIPHKIALLGLTRTFQTTRNWDNLTVLENMLVTPIDQTGEKFLNIFFKRKKIQAEERENVLKALEILDFLEITHIRDQLTSELSGGQKKLLAIGRLLMTLPKVLLLDEPLAGVNPTLGNKIMDKVVDLKKDLTIFLIEHDMGVIFNYSDEIFVMARGKVIAQGNPEEIQNNKEVIEAYLGADY